MKIDVNELGLKLDCKKIAKVKCCVFAEISALDSGENELDGKITTVLSNDFFPNMKECLINGLKDSFETAIINGISHEMSRS